MGTGVAGFFIGTTAENVLQLVDCSVLRVKPEGFVSPVKLKAASSSGNVAGPALIKSVNPDGVEQMIVKLISSIQPASVQISDLMSYPVVTLSPDTRMKEVYTILSEKGHTGIPVLDGGRLAGIISRRDFRKAKKRRH